VLFDLETDPDPWDFHGMRATSPLTVLSGANNSGKSAYLKGLKQHLGRTAYFMGPVRFYHVHQIGSQPKNDNELNELENQFLSVVQHPQQNYEQNFLDLNRILISLTDTQRQTLLDLCSELIGGKFTLQQVDPANKLSMHYVDVDGTNLGHTSTGTRLLMTLLGTCMDTRFSAMLIDEPELGLSPRVQQAFADFLQDPVARKDVFPHLANVYLATHSHVFLDRREPTNNFTVSREGKRLSVSQVQSVSELHQLQFNLLGNDLETIFLPSALVLVEGKTDHKYLERAVELGGDLQKSPYRGRLFVVVDSVHDASLKAALSAIGIPSEHIVEWEKNGIEYVYPSSLMANKFGCSEEALGELAIDGDMVEVRGVTFRKSELCDDIVMRITPETVLPAELDDKLLKPLASAID